MELSILAAKIIGLSYLAVAIGALAGKVNFSKMVEDFEKSSGLTFISGVFTFIMGALLVNYHNLWVKDWPVLVTLIAWLSLIKGFLLMTFPQFILIGKGLYKKTKLLGIFILILGLVFGYFGFFTPV